MLHKQEPKFCQILQYHVELFQNDFSSHLVIWGLKLMQNFHFAVRQALAEACGFDTSSCAPEGRLVTTLDSFTEEERILALECRKVLHI